MGRLFPHKPNHVINQKCPQEREAEGDETAEEEMIM